MKLSDYAKKHNVTYRTAWNRFKKGLIPNAYIDDTNHIIIDEYKTLKDDYNKCAIYARVSNNEAKDNLKRQEDRLKDFAIKNGFVIITSISEIASGLNDERPKLIKLLKDNSWNTLIVENKDRLTRFGFNYIKTLLEINNKRIIVVNQTDDEKIDLIQDLVSIIYSFSARMYGLRKRKNKEDIIKFLEE